MQAWEEFLTQQEKILGPETIGRWLRSLKVAHFDACNLYLEANDAFQVQWFEEHIRHKVCALLVNNNNHPIKVHLTACNVPPGKKSSRKRPPIEQTSIRNLTFTPDSIDPYATFNHFLATDSNQVALKLFSELGASDSANSVPLAAFNPIYIYGGSGVGKTHLLMAACNALTQKKLNVFYVRAETFTEHVVNAIRNGMMQEFRMAYRHVDVLIVDDMHLFARKNATQEEFFHTFNSLHTSGHQVILSANTAPGLLQEIEPRLVSRFEWGITLHLEKMSSTQLHQFILNRCSFLNFPLKEEVVEFLIATFAPNAKTIQKALDTLILRSHLDHPADIALDGAKDCLSQLINEHEKNALNPTKIVHAVADVYGITFDDIVGKSQSQECSIARQMAMFLCRKELKMPFMKIGSYFSRDHSTVMSSVRQIEKKAESQDKETCATISEILRRLD